MRESLLKNKLLLNAAFWWKCRCVGAVRYGVSQRYRAPSWRRVRSAPKTCERPHVALIADEITYQNVRGIWQVHLLSPQNWRDVLETEKPDVFFCESAWSGTADQKECWRYRIYRREGLRFDNRRELRNILRYCREAGIPTVFWNKEDPAYFGDNAHDFADTARWFSHVITTAEECVGAYRKMGCRSVHVMPFGYSPEIFHPLPGEFDRDRAVFFGGWYQEQTQRCHDIEQVFDMLLAGGMHLEIYDRHAGAKEKRFAYPEKYRPYLRPGVPYTEIPAVIGRPCYAVNINTVTDSETMYARRVPELMACGCVIVSNESRGLRSRFGDRIWFCGEDFDAGSADRVRRENQKEVLLNDTWKAKLYDLFKQLGLTQ